MSKKKRPTPPRVWEPMRLSHVLENGDAEDPGVRVEVWGNNLYTVSVKAPEGMAGPVHLSLHTHTRNARHDWRDMQRIKTEICGPEREAIELYPAESRVMDTSNEYHLWVLPEGEMLSIGYMGPRVVMDNTELLDPDNIDLAAKVAKDQLGIDEDITRKQLHRAKQRKLR